MKKNTEFERLKEKWSNYKYLVLVMIFVLFIFMTPVYTRLEVNLTYPLLTTEVTQNTTFKVNATATCVNDPCDTVYGTVQYNGSSSYPDTPINTTEGATPFYVIDSVGGAPAGIEITAIDTGGDVGKYSSIALDSNDKIHISYYNATGGDLRYCNNMEGTWSCTDVETTSDVGYRTSIAIDFQDHVHITHDRFISQYNDIHYCNNTLGYWSCDELIITGNTIDSSIAIDSQDYVHISYYDSPGGDSIVGKLSYCNNTLGYWSCGSVETEDDSGEFSSLAIDSDGKIHISHGKDADVTIGTDFDLSYCNNTLGTWTCTNVETGGETGKYSSIAIDSQDHVHISHQNSTDGDLRYCNNTAGSWTCTVVDSGGDVGWYSSIAIDKNNNIHIIHMNNTDDTLRYCYTNDFSTWNCQKVDDTGGFIFTYGRSIAIKKGRLSTSNSFSPNVHISYYNATTDDLMYTKISRNLLSCGSLSEDQSCQLNWTVNATGASDSEWKVGVLFNSTNSTIPDNHTDNTTIRITENIKPRYWDNSTNNTIAGQPTLFSLRWTDNIGLSGYIFSTNNTGTWINASWISFSGTINTSWNITTLNSTVGTTIQWKVYSNDTSNNWNVSDTYNLTTTDGTLPQYFDNSTNSTYAGQPVEFSLNWTDNYDLSGYFFSTNNTGTWTNSSFVSFSGTTNTSWNVTTLNSTVNLLVQWKYYANDSFDNWNTSLIYNLTTTIVSTPTTTTVPSGGGGGGGAGGGIVNTTTTTTNTTTTTSIPSELGKVTRSINHQIVKKTKDQIKDLIEQNEELKQGLQLATDKEIPKELITTTHEIQDKFEFKRELEIDQDLNESSLTLTIKYNGNKRVNDFMVYDIIPKSFAATFDRITVTVTEAEVIVIKQDPEYLINYVVLNSGEEKTITCSIDGIANENCIDEISAPTILAGSLEIVVKPLAIPTLPYQYIIITVVIVVVIIVIIVLIIKHPRKEREELEKKELDLDAEFEKLREKWEGYQ